MNATQQDLERACNSGDVLTMEQLLSRLGRDKHQIINAMPAEQYTLLYRACERGLKPMVELLLAHGAQATIHPVTFYSPLYIACYAGHIEIVDLLLTNFPDLVQVCTVERWLPLHAACRTGNVDMLFLLMGFSYPDGIMQTFSDPAIHQLPFDMNAKDADDRTALYLSCIYGHAAIVKSLLDYRVPEIVTPKSMSKSSTSVASPTSSGGITVSTQPDILVSSMQDSTQTLGSPGHEPKIYPVLCDVYSARGRTALHEAIMANHHEVVRILLHAKADVNLPILSPDSPVVLSCSLAEACRNGDDQMVDLLLQAGAQDIDHQAISAALANKFEALACKLLEKNVFVDPEYRINKKGLDLDLQSQLSAGRAVIPSSLFPTTPVMVNWHQQGLVAIREAWLTRATLHSNPKLKSSSPSGLLLSAITRIDLSKNELNECPVCIFQMISLRVMNLAYNKLESLPTVEQLLQASKSRKLVPDPQPHSPAHVPLILIGPVLEEIHVQNNRLETLPDWLFRLPNLVTLDGSNNKLTSIPSQVWLAPKLKDLNLSCNSLHQLPIGRDFISRTVSGESGAIEWDSVLFGNNPLTPLVLSSDADGYPPSVGSPSLSSDFAFSAKGNESDQDSLNDLKLVRADDTMCYQELKRHNMWQKTLESQSFTMTDDDTAEPQSKRSALSSLNLSHNLFESVPEGLPCVAPGLSRLNLASNSLRNVGSVGCYPSKLKHLDLSHNKIIQWFVDPPIPLRDGECMAVIGYGGPSSNASRDSSVLGLSFGAVTPTHNARQQTSPVASRRSQSIAAQRGHRSLSVAPGRLTESPTPALCGHRRHVRLENLRTLVLAANQLDEVELFLTPVATPVFSRDTPSPVGSFLPGSLFGGGAKPPASAAVVRPPASHDVASDRRRRQAGARQNSEFLPASPRRKMEKQSRKQLIFPNLSMLDLSTNLISVLPKSLSQLSYLSVLNLAYNTGLVNLPPELGMLTKLWNLNLSGCSLTEPLRSMIESRKYKTLDIIGYLKSVLEDSKLYCRLKLMVVGVQGIGKTSLLEQLRSEGSSKSANEGWASRMGHKDINRKTARGVNISTVGVDVGDWTYEPKRTKQIPSTFGPVTFRTWDFGGQREYYATHQYFLSRRSLYVVCWRITDGEAGINEITQWLVNIQARAANSPVLLVATHYDEVLSNRKKFPVGFVEDLQQLIKERFICLPDADKRGLPKVIDSVIVSCKTRHNVRHLANLIYSTAFELRSPGSKERLLEQKIPASYLQLEEIVTLLATVRRQQNKDPVLRSEEYRSIVQSSMLEKYNRTFRDLSELNQATCFLHENGVVLHYEDATLKDLYFIDPQWLCDMLAHVITIREINPFAKNGLMKTDDLKMLFKSSKLAATTLRQYILQLLQKFEVALTWDNRTLLIPCLLPDEYQLRAGYNDSEVKIPIKSRGWLWNARLMDTPSTAVISRDPNFPMSEETVVHTTTSPGGMVTVSYTKRIGPATGSVSCEPLRPPSPLKPRLMSPEVRSIPIFSLNRPNKTPAELDREFYLNCQQRDSPIRRLYLMAYIPSGFWSRLVARILSDELIPNLVQQYFRASADIKQDSKLSSILETSPEWLLWQTGMEIKFLGHSLFSLKEFLPLAEIRDVNYKDIKFKYQQDQNWLSLSTTRHQIIEIYLPCLLLTLRYQNQEGQARTVWLQSDAQIMARILALCVELIDTLLEDWYPSLGTRFVHTSEGKYLVTRLVPCPQCLLPYFQPKIGDEATTSNADGSWTILSLNDSALKTKSGTNESGGSSESTSGVSGDNITPLSLQQHGGMISSIFRSKTFDSGFHLGGQQHVDVVRKRGSNSSQDSGVTMDVLTADAISIKCVSLTDLNHSSVKVSKPPPDNSAYSFTVEECILNAHEAQPLQCPTHAGLALNDLAPDTVFSDLNAEFLVDPEFVKRGKMLGRGAFGFVFKANVKFNYSNEYRMAALKMLQPVDPGFGAHQSAINAYKAAWQKWRRDPIQYACRAYCTARQELQVLNSLSHPQVISLVGVCPRPLALIVELAPLGSLNNLLSNYRRSGARLHATAVQDTAQQVARALEYLHQQRLIYRDLKSENVLVWQFPPPFSQLTTVQLKLGDYGISRSVLPSGGSKGFGGTEGFMAPEIMRYNGEEEYTEKVDCFSFGMFLYELLTLRLPFEGQEQVKEFILDGGRPSLAPKELLHPSNLLDLMVASWAHSPVDRPSASQIVSITSAPEFGHLLDVVSLADQDSAVLCGSTVTVDDSSYSSSATEDQFACSSEGEIWLSRADGQISILACNQRSWIDYKSLAINDDSFVTCLCVVDETVWLGELTGIVRIYCAKSYQELMHFSLGPYLNGKNVSSDGTSTTSVSTTVPVSSMLWLPTLHRVVVAAGQQAAVALCHSVVNSADLAPSQTVVVATYVANCIDVKCMAAVPNLHKSGQIEVWCGGADAQISILKVFPERISELATRSHFETQLAKEKSFCSSAEVNHLVSSKTSDLYVWSYVFPGCTLYQWNRMDRQIVAKLDCSKIAPVSESISTINIDDGLNPIRCQVTSMCLLERESCGQMYVGTTWGTVIVTEADQLRPITAFRPHTEEVKVILPMVSYPNTSNSMLKRLSSTSNPTGSSSVTSRKSSKPSLDNLGRLMNRLSITSPTRQIAMSHSQSMSSPNESAHQPQLCHLITVGKGYRYLLQRFLDNYKDEPDIMESRNRDIFAMLWRTEDWIQ